MKTRLENRRVLLGVALVIFGILWGIHTLFPHVFNLFFHGWWTLFIIVPCFCGLLYGNNKTGNAIGLAVGVLLLLCEQTTISWWMFSHLLLVAIVIILGLKLIFSGKPIKKEAKIETGKILRDGRNIQTYEVTFGEQKIVVDEEVFEGADIECSFAGMQIDLTKAIINTDVSINVECSFGGITIITPENCGIKIAAKSTFGGIGDKRSRIPENPEHTITITGEITFAGVEIK